MKKKISLKYYRDASSSEIAEIDYNELKTKHVTKEGIFYRLLGSIEDRIEAYLMRIGYVKINSVTYNKLKDGLEQERTILQYGNSLGEGVPEPKQRAKRV